MDITFDIRVLSGQVKLAVDHYGEVTIRVTVPKEGSHGNRSFIAAPFHESKGGYYIIRRISVEVVKDTEVFPITLTRSDSDGETSATATVSNTGSGGVIDIDISGKKIGLFGDGKVIARVVLLDQTANRIFASDFATLTMGSNARGVRRKSTHVTFDIPDDKFSRTRAIAVQIHAEDNLFGGGRLVELFKSMNEEIDEVYESFKDAEWVKAVAAS